ncbi:hypothetical protein HDV00_010454 [Rhizophlyctis rosea]|nr:hypothetical protein HDV00_010454 [Rhizophlyctis rosea]
MACPLNTSGPSHNRTPLDIITEISALGQQIGVSEQASVVRILTGVLDLIQKADALENQLTDTTARMVDITNQFRDHVQQGTTELKARNERIEVLTEQLDDCLELLDEAGVSRPASVIDAELEGGSSSVIIDGATTPARPAVAPSTPKRSAAIASEIKRRAGAETFIKAIDEAISGDEMDVERQSQCRRSALDAVVGNGDDRSAGAGIASIEDVTVPDSVAGSEPLDANPSPMIEDDQSSYHEPSEDDESDNDSDDESTSHRSDTTTDVNPFTAQPKRYTLTEGGLLALHETHATAENPKTGEDVSSWLGGLLTPKQVRDAFNKTFNNWSDASRPCPLMHIKGSDQWWLHDAYVDESFFERKKYPQLRALKSQLEARNSASSAAPEDATTPSKPAPVPVIVVPLAPGVTSLDSPIAGPSNSQPVLPSTVLESVAPHANQAEAGNPGILSDAKGKKPVRNHTAAPVSGTSPIPDDTIPAANTTSLSNSIILDPSQALAPSSNDESTCNATPSTTSPLVSPTVENPRLPNAGAAYGTPTPPASPSGSVAATSGATPSTSASNNGVLSVPTSAAITPLPSATPSVPSTSTTTPATTGQPPTFTPTPPVASPTVTTSTHPLPTPVPAAPSSPAVTLTPAENLLLEVLARKTVPELQEFISNIKDPATQSALQSMLMRAAQRVQTGSSSRKRELDGVEESSSKRLRPSPTPIQRDTTPHELEEGEVLEFLESDSGASDRTRFPPEEGPRGHGDKVRQAPPSA